jgi:hypothetical protein
MFAMVARMFFKTQGSRDTPDLVVGGFLINVTLPFRSLNDMPEEERNRSVAPRQETSREYVDSTIGKVRPARSNAARYVKTFSRFRHYQSLSILGVDGEGDAQIATFSLSSGARRDIVRSCVFILRQYCSHVPS